MTDALSKIKQYYIDYQKNKIFCERIYVGEKRFAILYDYDKNAEIKKFVSNFSTYLPYYVYNQDTLECIHVDATIEEELLRVSKECWKESPLVPKRQTATNGIFGEVLMDFYSRIVEDTKLITTYASRRDFKSNSENHGFDNMYFKIVNGQVEYIFAESKFVTDKNKATSEFIQDIKGKPTTDSAKEKIGHLTIEYMNEYISFVVEKNTPFSESERQLLRPFFRELNNVLINKKRDFISFLIEKNIHVKCIFFAVFQSDNTKPEDLLQNYENILSEAKTNLEKMGLNNYEIEIIFVPTKHKSMEIKGAINGYYE